MIFSFVILTGVILLDTTFSNKNGDRFVISVFVDSIIMNLGKLATLSKSDSVSVRELLSLFEEEKAMIANYYSQIIIILCSTTHHGVQLMLGINQGSNPFALSETGIPYQYTHAKSIILSFCQILLLITQQSNSGHKSYLSTIDPQPPPSSTYGIKGWK